MENIEQNDNHCMAMESYGDIVWATEETGSRYQSGNTAFDPDGIKMIRERGRWFGQVQRCKRHDSFVFHCAFDCRLLLSSF